MPDRQIAIGHPNPIAPRQIGRGGVHVSIRRANIRRRRKGHGIQTQPVHPILQIGLARGLQPGKPLGQMRDGAEIAGRVGAGMVRVMGDVVIKARIPIRQRAGRLRKDARAVNLRQTVQPRLAIRREKITPRPDRQIDDLAFQVFRTHQSPRVDLRRAGTVALIIRDDGKLRHNHLSPRRLHRRPRLTHQRQN